MAVCRNHPHAEAVGRCAGCAEEYCWPCLVELNGQKYCGACKTMALEGGVPTAIAGAWEAQEMTNSTAQASFTTGLVGFVLGTIGCFYVVGLVCGIVAITKGLAAKRELAQYPARMDRFKSTAGIVFGSLGIFGNLLNLAAYIMHHAR